MTFPLWSFTLKYTPSELQGSQYDGSFSEKLIFKIFYHWVWKRLQTIEMIYEITKKFLSSSAVLYEKA